VEGSIRTCKIQNWLNTLLDQPTCKYQLSVALFVECW
jgi:hypothetical protein